MNFEQNLFISYAHIDDQPLTPGEKGWITRFHATLKAILSMRMGRDAKIWRDEKLQGNDVFSSEIVAQFKQSAILVSIVTPRYLHSEWCTREAREFCQSAEQSGGLVVGNKSRVFKVIKTPVDAEESDSLPAHMKNLLGFEFFAYKDGAPLELDPDYGPEYSQLYKQKVAILAQDIAQLLKTLQAEGGASKSNDKDVQSESRAPSKPAVYLAECSYDRKPARELLEGELKRLGYPVLPDKRLPQDEAEYVSAVESLLARCALSIHLVGEKYGTVPDGPTDKSVSILQNELAVVRCRSGGLQRLIWLPQGTRSEQAPQSRRSPLPPPSFCAATISPPAQVAVANRKFRREGAERAGGPNSPGVARDDIAVLLSLFPSQQRGLRLGCDGRSRIGIQCHPSRFRCRYP
jgi:hypothetical protein